MNEQLRVRSCSKGKTDAVSRTQRGRQFHQRKTREGGGNIVNGCRVAVLEKKKRGNRKVLRQSAEQTQDGGGGRMNPARTGRCQVGKKELSVLSCPQRTAGASKKKKEEDKERKKEQKCLWSQEDTDKESKKGEKER